jgi:hypothetical protein
MGHHHVLRFLFVHGLAVIHLVGGLGVEDQQHGLVENQILLHVRMEQRETLPIKTNNT